MRRRILSFLSLSILAIIASSCTEQAPSDLGSRAPGTLSIAPRFSVVSGMQIGPISRIRLTARLVPGNNVVADTVITVSPDEGEWRLNFNVPPDAGNIVVEITALSVLNGVETIEFSGVTAPITVLPGQPNAPSTPVTLTPGPIDNLTVTAVSISPRTPSVVEGGTVQLAAAITGGGPNVRVLWGTLDPAVATVDVNGFVTTLRNGSARIMAVAGPRQDTVTIIASQRVASVTVTPDTQRLSTFGSEALFTARVLDPRGAEILGAGATFAITNSAIADQVAPGRFRAKANGTTSIVVAAASVPTVIRTATLIVAQRASRIAIAPPSATANSIGATQQFTAQVSDGNGNGMDAPVTWRSNNTNIATITNTGFATARANGTADIVAVANAGSPDSVVAHASYQVLQSIGALTVTPDGVQLNSIGDTVRFTVQARDGNGNVMPAPTVTWQVANATVGSIDANGTFRAESNGATVVTAIAGTIRASVSLQVQQVPTSVTVTRSVDTMVVNTGKAFNATVRDARGNPLAGAVVTWASSDTTKAVVNNAGFVTARAAGTVTISATHNGIRGTATLVVQNDPRPNLRPTLVFSPGTTLVEHDTVKVSVRVRNIGGSPSAATTTQFQILNAAGNVVVFDTTLTVRILTANDSVVFSVNRVAEGAFPDSVKLRVIVDPANVVAESIETDNSITSNTVFYQLQTVASVQVSPANVSPTSFGDTVRFTAVARDSRGFIMPNVVFNWTSQTPALGSVNGTGLFTALGNGNAIVRASVGAVFGEGVAHVQQVPVSVSVTRAVDTMVVNTGKLFTSTVRDGRGNAIAGAAVLWASSDTTKATVNAGGFVTARAAGNVTITASHNGIQGNASLTVQVDPRPNLQPAVTFSPGLTVVENDTMRFSVRIKNVGAGAAAATTAQFQILNAAGGPAVFDTTLTVRALAASPDSVIFALTRVANAFPDSVKIRIMVDPANVITELSEADNLILTNAVFYQLQTVATIQVSPASVNRGALGDTVRFTAVARDSRGNVMPNVRFNWTSQTPALGSVDTAGLFTAAANGDAAVRAAIGGVFGEGVAHIQQVATSFALTTHADSVFVNATRQLTAQARDARNNLIATAIPTWETSNSTNAIVDANGLVTGKSVGTAFIKAVYNTFRDSTLVTVKTLGTPNLIVESITTDRDSIYENDSTRITMIVKNVGTADAVASTVRLRLLDAVSLGLIGPDTITAAVRALAPNKADTLVRAFSTTGIGLSFPDNVKLFAKADDANVVAESNETDNELTSAAHPVSFVARTWAPLAASTNWLDVNNWSPRGVPRPGVDITFPAGLASYPVLTSNVIAHDIHMLSDANIELGSFNLMLTGRQIFGTQITGTGTVILTGVNATVAGVFPNVNVTQGATVVGGFEVSHDLAVSGGDFDVNGYDVNVLGNFSTVGSGALKMTTAHSQLNVSGNVTFNGASTAGKITVGFISTHGNFFAAAGAFSASADNNLYMYGPSPTTLELQSPGTNSTSNHFATLYIANGGGVTVTGDIVVMDELAFGTAGPTLTGTGTATLMGEFEDDVANGLSFQMANVILAGTDDSEIPNVLNSNVTLKRAQHLQSDGSLLVQGDLTIDGGALFLDLSTVSVNGDFSTVNGGSINMQDEGDIFHVHGNATFGGGNSLIADGDLIIGGNFTGSGSAEAFRAGVESVVRMYNGNDRSTPGTISLADGQHFGGLEIDWDTELVSENITVIGRLALVNCFKLFGTDKSLTTTGDVEVNGSCNDSNRTTQPEGAARRSAQRNIAMPDPGYYPDEQYRVTTTVLAGSSQLLPTYITTNVNVTNGVTLNFRDGGCQNTEVHGNVTVSGSGGNLILFCYLTVDEDFATASGGTLTMPSRFCECGDGFLEVYGNMNFNGGSEDGKLNSGSIMMHGDDKTFTAQGDPTSFKSGSNFYLLGGNKTITLSNPATQTFGTVFFESNGTLTLTNGMVVGFQIWESDQPDLVPTFTGSGSLVVGQDSNVGASIHMNGAIFDGITLELNHVNISQFTTVNFASPPVEADNLIIRSDTLQSTTLNNVTFNNVPWTGHYWIHTYGTGDVYLYDPTPFTPNPSYIREENPGHLFWPANAGNTITAPAKPIKK